MQRLAIEITEGGPLPDVDAYGLDKAKMLRGMGIIKLGQARTRVPYSLTAALFYRNGQRDIRGGTRLIKKLAALACATLCM